VTYGTGEGEGDVTAHAGSNGHPVTNGYFASEGTNISFVAKEANMFDKWELGTRPGESGNDGSEVTFSFETLMTGTPLVHVIKEHTHALGHFKDVQPVALTVSKIIEGAFGNKNTLFEFIAVFTDAHGNPLPEGQTFSYTGDVIASSGAIATANGILTLDGSGSVLFTLGHGQVITIEGISHGINVQIIELSGEKYEVYFTDSENPDVMVRGNDTTPLSMTADRTLEFINKRSNIPMTGLNTGNAAATMLLPLLLSAFASAALIVSIAARNRKCVKRTRNV